MGTLNFVEKSGDFTPAKKKNHCARSPHFEIPHCAAALCTTTVTFSCRSTALPPIVLSLAVPLYVLKQTTYLFSSCNFYPFSSFPSSTCSQKASAARLSCAA